MRLIEELRELLQQTAEVRQASGISFGQRTHGSPVSVAVYYEEEFQVIKGAQGQDVVSKGFYITEPSTAIAVEDLIDDHHVLAVHSFFDPDTQQESHKEVYV